jgi:hypothetical protein
MEGTAKPRWDHTATMPGGTDEEPRYVTADGATAISQWMPLWRKRTLTRAIRMIGPFTVETREGELRCPDGYLAIDSEGWPYPIARSEFEAIYEPATEED